MTIRECDPALITETIGVAATTKIRTGLRFASEHADDDYLTWRVESRQANGDYALDSRFKIARTGQLIVKTGSHFDFESDDNPNGVPNLRVIADDGSAGSDSGPVSQDVLMQILDLDEAPTSMSFVDGINSALISENPTTAQKLADIIFEDDALGDNRAEIDASDTFEIKTGTELLLAGFIPGAFSALIYAMLIVTIAMVVRNFGPPVSGFTWYQRLVSLPPSLPIFIVVGVIILFIYNPFGGDAWGTPTEGGALGAFVVFCIAVARGMRWPQLRQALIETVKLSAMIFAII